MQNPNEDTEWNDILRSKGILPEKEITENDIISLVEETVQEKQVAPGKNLSELDLDELDELEDDEEILEYRKKRIAELKAAAKEAKFHEAAELREISGQDYVNEVNKAGPGVWVVLHLYKRGLPLCDFINCKFSDMAPACKKTKFLKILSTSCIPDYPDKNLPTVFVYYEGNLLKHFIGLFDLNKAQAMITEVEKLIKGPQIIEGQLKESQRQKFKCQYINTRYT